MRLSAIVLVVVTAASLAHADELQRLRDENAALRARVSALEQENAKLRGEADTTGLVPALRESARATVRTEFDADRGQTVVETDPWLLELDAGPHSRHWLVLRTSHEGSAAPGPSTGAEMVIEAASSGGAYRDVAALELGVDDGRATLARLRYDVDRTTPIRGSGVTVREVVVLQVPPATLEKMATARRIEGTLGPLRFHLTPEQLASVHEFASRAGAKR